MQNNFLCRRPCQDVISNVSKITYAMSIFILSCELPTPGRERKDCSGGLPDGDWWNSSLTAELRKTTPNHLGQKGKKTPTFVAPKKIPKYTKSGCKKWWVRASQCWGTLYLSEYRGKPPATTVQMKALIFLVMSFLMPIKSWKSAVHGDSQAGE